MLPRPSGIVVLLTDFGSRDPYVGLMKGMALRAYPKAQIVDLTHDVEPQDVALGAFFLRVAAGRFPGGTVFVGVVDPGVGTERRALCALAHDSYWLAPDNGVLSEVLDGAQPGIQPGIQPGGHPQEVRQLDLQHLRLSPASRTFHGRDVFAPVAGALAGARFGFSSVGPRCLDPVRGKPLTTGTPRVVHVDSFGNLVTNVPATAIATVRSVRIGDRSMPVRGTYADAAPGALVCLINSYDLLEIAENQGSAAATLGCGRGAAVVLES
ncbi:MAG: S-adenosyl-l-methionine hydroxide adenosyltransferase family protein [Planctomycetota bacterium]